MSAPYYADDAVTLHAGDCLDVLPTLPDNSVDAVVTDPPYGLEFMGKDWDKFGGGKSAPPGIGDRSTAWVSNRGWNDHRCRTCGHLTHGGSPCHCDNPDFARADDRWPMFQQWCQLWAAECLRVLKPGGWMLAFGGSRTAHRLTCAVEDAGFEIRDGIPWLFGQGFPKSLDVSKAIDKAAGAEREVIGLAPGSANRSAVSFQAHDNPTGYNATPEGDRMLTAPATADAQRWQGWGTALKPGHEMVTVARKPLVGTVVANVLRWGTGALNIDACRIEADWETDPTRRGWQGRKAPDNGMWGAGNIRAEHSQPNTAGRWPANVALDETAAAALDRMSGDRRSHDTTPGGQWIGPKVDGVYELGHERNRRPIGRGDDGGASRFFYTAKADSGERITYTKPGSGNGRVTGLGGKVRQCNVCETRAIESGAGEPSCGHGDYRWAEPTTNRADVVSHPTVKPLDLMRWLVRLVTPPGGVILEPFAGSGTTVEAALLEGFRCIAIEREADYLPLITQRINRRRDPIAYLAAAGEDLGLFDEDAS